MVMFKAYEGGRDVVIAFFNAHGVERTEQNQNTKKLTSPIPFSWKKGTW